MSDPRQAKNLSLGTQLSTCEDYCRREGFEIRERFKSDLLVLGNEAGNRDTHILEKLQRICRRANIKKTTVHALRHSFGTHLRMAGVSLADIADLLGHKDLATTQIYAKVQQEHLRAIVAKLAPLVPAVAGPAPKPMSLENATQPGNEKEEPCKLLETN